MKLPAQIFLSRKPYRDRDGIWSICTNDPGCPGFVLATTASRKWGEAIARACNGHEALVAALTKWCEYYQHGGTGIMLDDIYEEARAALAAAGEA